ncbi:hypothetical protein OIDMADRAFT_119807 [Oidiodendron maius Zn]|uniref:Peptidase S8/S53 domain-containing protein n=1 Tax=Oidiodendron maius (strain Zn) TaxID=913774 RepID=A0A0C3CWC8_OIDMZ|nr:hypothetical protein OIDMADRAFT_119807 [Oidiodendron maius Zn]
MKLKCTFGLLALAGRVASLTVTTNQQSSSNSNTTEVPNAFIIELQPDFYSSLPPKERFARTAVASDVNYQVRHEYSSNDYFLGLSVLFNKPVDLASLRQTAGVKNAWPVSRVSRPQPFGSRESRTKSASSSSNTTLPNLRGSARVNQPLDMGNVRRLHDQGIRGKGVLVALIDTGVDYRHPALGGGFGPGHKIALGYDFVGDDYDGTNTPVPGEDPLVTCPGGGHGSHTTGIVAMEDPDNQGFGLIGVAPEATIAVYRVFGCSGSVTNDVLIAAMLRAAQDGAIVLSMSIGEYDVWEEINVFDPIVSRLAQNGTVVVAAVGNFGTAGLYSTSTPAISVDALSVGSIENEIYPTLYAAHNDKNEPLHYISVFPLSQKDRMDVFQLGTGLGIPINATVASGCYDPAWDAAANMSVNWNTTILLVSLTPNCGPVWSGPAPELGVTTILVYIEDEEELIAIPESGQQPEILYLDYNNSQILRHSIGQMSPGQTYGLRFDGERASDALNPYGGSLDVFSSFGPTVELSLQPKIAAPGGSILSTWPLEEGGYDILSGTSMAVPFVAGSYALLKSQYPELTVSQLVARLQTTCSPVLEHNSTLLASTAQQGAGLVNAYAAVMADSTITPSELSLRDSTKPAPQNITIRNDSKSQKKYILSHDPAAYFRTFTDYLAGNPGDLNTDGTVIPEPVFASADFSITSLTLKPGHSATIQVQITPPAELYPFSYPVYAGFVTISTDRFAYSIPYVGVPYNRSEVGPIAHNITTTIPYNSPSILSLNGTSDSIFDAYQSKPNIDAYTWSTNNSLQVAPLLRVDILLPSRIIRLELVPANTSFVPDLYGFDPKVHIEYQATPQPLLSGFLGVPTYGVILEYTIDTPENKSPATVQPTFYHFVSFLLGLPKLTNDEDVSYNISSGDYRPLCRALRLNGNKTDAADYQSWLGPVIRAKIPKEEFP